MHKLKGKKIGLALGGGAVLGAVHIGVLKALEEQKIEIAAISGTSAGAIAAALYAFLQDAAKVQKIVLEFEWSKLSSLTFSKYALLSNQKIAQIIEKNIGKRRFDEAKIPLGIVATDITTGEKIILEKGDVADAVMASTSIPGIFVPIQKDGKFLVDGGVVENIPLSYLKTKKLDFIIGVDLVTEHSLKKPENIIEVLYNSFSFLIKANKKSQLKDADLIIQPDLTQFNAVEMSQIKDLIDIGYNETMKALKNI